MSNVHEKATYSMDLMPAVVKTTPAITELRRVPLPTYGPRDVLILVRATALCGTDLHLYDWNAWAQGAGVQLPLILGHECCGDVVAVGTRVDSLSIGDRVAVETHIPCGVCRQCRNGEQHICHNLRLFGIHVNGCFAEYAVTPETCARKIPAEISYDVGAVMEPLGTAFRAAYELSVGGACVVIIGCGPIGLFAVAAARYLDASRIIATDINTARLELAGRLGAHLTLNPFCDDVMRTVLEATGGYGADAVIETSGNAAAIKQSFGYLRKGCRLALIGLPEQQLAIDLSKDVVFKEARITGIHGRKMFETWTVLEKVLISGRLAIDQVITHRFPLTRWYDGIALAKSGEACKIIYYP